MKVMLTSRPYWEDDLMDEVKDLGEFRPTEFRGVFEGEIEALDDFLKKVERNPIFALSRIIPIDHSFNFTAENAVGEFSEAARSIMHKIKKGESYAVKVERRGLKERLSSQELAREVGTRVLNMLMDRDGVEPTVDLDDPDQLIIFETLRRWCGLGIISKEMRAKSDYLMIP